MQQQRRWLAQSDSDDTSSDEGGTAPPLRQRKRVGGGTRRRTHYDPALGPAESGDQIDQDDSIDPQPSLSTASHSVSAVESGTISKQLQSFLDPSDDEHSADYSSLTASLRSSRQASPQGTLFTTSTSLDNNSMIALPVSVGAYSSSPSFAGAALGTGGERMTVRMEFGDEYFGEVEAFQAPSSSSSSKQAPATPLYVPHGTGTLQSITGKHCYCGEFQHRERSGQGKLLTEKYVLWCKWKANRPDLTASARLDWTSGDKYSGYLSSKTDNGIFSSSNASNRDGASLPSTAGTDLSGGMSKFSTWVSNTVFRKERWGELVEGNGTRYFGQWENDKRSGMGCLTLHTGERYVGMFKEGLYDGPGVLFARSALTPGGHPLQAQVTTTAVFDGVWAKGAFCNTGGHLTLPCGTKVVASWSSASCPADGAIYFARRPRILPTLSAVQEAEQGHFSWSHSSRPSHQRFAPQGRGWVETSQWEPLLCQSSDDTKRRAAAFSRQHRLKILRCHSKDTLQSLLRKFVLEDTVCSNSLKIFRRCFYFFYGTCGASSEIGGGLGGNSLGWCHFRDAYGGCIHRGKGRRISISDTNDALGDIFSFIRSLCRWVEEILGVEAFAKIAELEGEALLPRICLDAAMGEVFPVLINLYSHAYSDEELEVQRAVERLQSLSMDDLGVQFARTTTETMFDPYADASRCFEELSRVKTLSGMIHTLTQWSREIDVSTRLSQVSLHEEQLSEIATALKQRSTAFFPTPSEALDDDRSRGTPLSSGKGNSSFAMDPSPQKEVPRIDNAGAASEVQQLLTAGGGHSSDIVLNRSFSTPSNSPVLQAAAMPDTMPPSNGELPPRLAPSSSSAPLQRRHESKVRLLDSMTSSAVESGSADDLLPIHQYVLIKGARKVPKLLAMTKLLIDLSTDDSVIDATSQDSFLITTLQACVSVLPELRPNIRDLQSMKCKKDHALIVIPLSVYDRRIEDTLRVATSMLGDVRPETLQTLAAWMPCVVDHLGEMLSMLAQGSSSLRECQGQWPLIRLGLLFGSSFPAAKRRSTIETLGMSHDSQRFEVPLLETLVHESVVALSACIDGLDVEDIRDMLAIARYVLQCIGVQLHITPDGGLHPSSQQSPSEFDTAVLELLSRVKLIVDTAPEVVDSISSSFATAASEALLATTVLRVEWRVADMSAVAIGEVCSFVAKSLLRHLLVQ